MDKEFDEKFCFECGQTIKAKAEICPKCGVRQPTLSNGLVATANGRSRIAAALFAILLGGLGIHKFYLGQTGQGVLYLLFCLTLIPALIGFIEGVVLLSMTDEAFARKYGTI
jgi:TM2 domain-containing membrane protein YozV